VVTRLVTTAPEPGECWSDTESANWNNGLGIKAD